jgi:thiol-disulfide isomerase/thioredoxin
MLKKSFYTLLFFSLLFSCKKGEVKEVSQKVTSVKSYSYNELKPLLERNDGKTYVVNFWATWCAPCVKELPAFEKLNEEYAAKNVEVILVSLDFPKQVDKRLIPFINKNNLQSKVVLLNDVNEDVWIKAIDTTWSGAIPATLIYNTKGRNFYEQSFDYEMLETELKTIL